MATLRADHLVYAVPDLTEATTSIERLTGVRPSPGGKHVGLGTWNSLLALGGEAYLEIIAPDPEQPEPSRPRPFGVGRLREPKLVNWAIRESRLEDRIASARARGYDPGTIRAGGRALPDGTRIDWRIVVPEGFVTTEGGLVPFLIDWGSAPHPAASAPAGCRLVGLRGRHPDPAKALDKLQALDVALDVAEGPEASLIATLDTPAGKIELS